MSQSGPADAVPPRKRRVVWQLIALVAIPALLGLALTGLRVTNEARSAQAYGLVGRLAMLGQQVNGLAQAMEDERSATAEFISGGRPAAGLQALHQQYVITDGRAARVRRLVLHLGRGYPAQTRASARAVLASIAELPGLRRRAAQRQVSALAVINGYSAATSGLFPVNDGIANPSGNSALITSVMALGALSRMTDQAAQQQAILRVALAQGRFGPGALTALLTAQARQASDLVAFRSSATPEEGWALTKTLAGPLSRQARAVEQRATGAGNGALALGPQASQQWWGGMSYTVGWMRQAQQQLTDWITAYAQALQRRAIRSAMITGGAGLAALLLVLLAIMFVARSMVRRLRRLETAALQAAGASPRAEEAARGGAETQGRAGASAISANFFQRSHSLLKRLLWLIDNLELSEEDPDRLASLFQVDHLATRMWRNADSALVLAGHETPRRSTEPLSLVDVLRAAVSEIEQYDRVILNVQQGVSVSGSAAADTAHLLAELLENATRFSPRTTQVTVSGHMARGGGSLISVTDSGPGMPEEQLKQLNWQLAHPSLADVAAAGPVGLSAVAHLAARHDIRVTLSRPPDGGTTAEVFLPAALILPDAMTGNRPRQGGAAPRIGPGEGADGWVAAAELPFSALRFGAGAALEPETDPREAVPLILGAPAPSPAPDTSPGGTVPRPVGADPLAADPVGADPVAAEPGGVLPIFESVESGYFRTLGQGLLSGTASAEMPQRVPRPRSARGVAVDEMTRQATAAESAEVTRSRLASFQRGSRRARATAQANRSAKQPDHDD